jgi:lysophospholipase L1-like esterase
MAVVFPFPFRIKCGHFLSCKKFAMKIPRLFLIVCCWVLVVSGGATAADAKPHLSLPPTLYAVPGVPMNIDFRNAILVEPEEGYVFKVDCDLGISDGKQRWTVIAEDDEVGEHVLKMRLSDADGKLVDEAATMVRVVPRDAGKGREMALLIIGDSLTAATHYSNEIGRLLSEPENPQWTMLGTALPRTGKTRVAHEGYGGWTWGSFNTHYGAEEWVMKDGRKRKDQSPFLFVGQPGGSPKLDIARYIREKANGREPDYVTFLLGVNDCFHADPEDPAAVEAKFVAMTEQAEILLAAFREALPNADLGVCLTPPPNARDAAFVANYKDKYTRKGWRSIQYRLVERQLQHFGGREKEHIFVVPTSLDLDPVTGYPEDNGVHPNESGYQRIGASIYAWLKWRMAEGGNSE